MRNEFWSMMLRCKLEEVSWWFEASGAFFLGCPMQSCLQMMMEGPVSVAAHIKVCGCSSGSFFMSSNLYRVDFSQHTEAWVALASLRWRISQNRIWNGHQTAPWFSYGFRKCMVMDNFLSEKIWSFQLCSPLSVERLTNYEDVAQFFQNLCL